MEFSSFRDIYICNCVSHMMPHNTFPTFFYHEILINHIINYKSIFLKNAYFLQQLSIYPPDQRALIVHTSPLLLLNPLSISVADLP